MHVDVIFVAILLLFIKKSTKKRITAKGRAKNAGSEVSVVFRFWSFMCAAGRPISFRQIAKQNF